MAYQGETQFAAISRLIGEGLVSQDDNPTKEPALEVNQQFYETDGSQSVLLDVRQRGTSLVALRAHVNTRAGTIRFSEFKAWARDLPPEFGIGRHDVLEYEQFDDEPEVLSINKITRVLELGDRDAWRSEVVEGEDLLNYSLSLPEEFPFSIHGPETLLRLLTGEAGTIGGQLLVPLEPIDPRAALGWLEKLPQFGV